MTTHPPAPTTGTLPAAPDRLRAIEGLRAYLALWVVAGHVLWASGIHKETLSGIALLVDTPEFAVDVFVILSGFVIFLALATKKDDYRQFVVRRFFRLFPLFILLFFLAIPISTIAMWNATHAARYFSPADVNYGQMLSWWDDLRWHVPLHLTMLHGAVPERWLPNAPGAFLIPAWSVSLEWQFYLVAPLAFVCATSAKWAPRLALLLVCTAMMFLAYGNVDSVAYGAALPYHVEHFAIGGASYWLYERRSKLARADGWFILACVTAGSIYLLRGSILSRSLIPIILWIVFLGLVLEQPSSRAHRLLSPFFTHPAVRYLGSISFSVYLSHMLVISLVQFVLLETVPELDRSTHVAILLVATLAAALPISIALHRHVEVPGIAFGRRVAERLGAGRPARTPDTAFRDGRSTDMPIPGWPARE